MTTCAAGTQCEIVETPIMSFVQCVDIDECLPGNGGDVECSADAGLQSGCPQKFGNAFFPRTSVSHPSKN